MGPFARSIGVGEGNGGAFFSGYGDRVGAMWTAYRDAVVRCVEEGGDEEAIVDAAVETFEALERWLGGTLAERRRAVVSATESCQLSVMSGQ